MVVRGCCFVASHRTDSLLVIKACCCRPVWSGPIKTILPDTFFSISFPFDLSTLKHEFPDQNWWFPAKWDWSGIFKSHHQSLILRNAGFYAEICHQVSFFPQGFLAAEITVCQDLSCSTVLLSFLLLQSHSKRSSKIKSPWSVFSVTSSYVTVTEISTVLKEFIIHIFYFL